MSCISQNSFKAPIEMALPIVIYCSKTAHMQKHNVCKGQ